MNLKLILVSLIFSTHTTSIFALAISPQRTVLVTGGAGYIGSHTCLELLNIPDEQYRVIVVDNLDNSSEESLKRVKDLTGCDPKRLQFRNCDIRDKEGLRKGNFLKKNELKIKLLFEMCQSDKKSFVFVLPS